MRSLVGKGPFQKVRGGGGLERDNRTETMCPPGILGKKREPGCSPYSGGRSEERGDSAGKTREDIKALEEEKNVS